MYLLSFIMWFEPKLYEDLKEQPDDKPLYL